MPTIERSDQLEDQTKDEKGSPSGDESNSGKTETKQIKQPKKVAVKKKTARKKAAKKTAGSRMAIQNNESNSSKTEPKQIKQAKTVAVKKKTARKKTAKKTAVSRMDPARKKESQTGRKEMQPVRPSGSDQGASVTVSEAAKARPAEQNQPQKPVETSVSPAAAPPHSQPRPGGGSGLMGFWIKVGTSAFIILAGIIGIYSFFSEDEATSRPEATQAAASATADTGTTRGVVVVNPESLHGYSNAPGTFAGAAVANVPAVETAITAGATPGVTPAANQPRASRRDATPPIPHSGQFSEQAARYRPELYRPLEPEQVPRPPTQPGAVNETPRAPVASVFSYYPQPGAYTYPPAPPHYGGRSPYYPY